MKLTLIKTENLENKKEELRELENQLDLIKLVTEHFETSDDHILTKDGSFFKEDLDSYDFSKYNIALLKQQIKKTKKEIFKENTQIINGGLSKEKKQNHLRLV